ncbi:YkuJ family protein [Lactiplantibacillus mudanjiangensis]|uniref:DUF1797 domain-containing protein n=1 Tax=Lactiplantibacillus mudanjiangensis TaxID=1296538 RepID=A0A660E115_9LACO|nr:YkuJ family protein [Lactiplantibacillus mudanjiangensis]VDG17486.1 hypothetical protein MUDAN_BIHEEGNE_00002 [Lactiplantibacillus mudanjiangensis]VDG24664.1 hypothetical protein MUDAN_IGPPGNFN_02858 [Lactiplantibacillus mudanjiangensis]VDG27688.1 hypothetical protein MUDAN_MDHGFNIF_02521 [Lactiplantibacillus mudanjiangensis]VDG32834.1 hypothetical protein MUDAN_DOGOELCO_02082 [Lactiplantibacillus mudanjiangensis]
MEKSELTAILKRLEAMRNTEATEVQSRRFEKEGVERGEVAYDPATSTYTLQEFNPDQTFEFDNIDLVAIELYDLLADN